MIGSTRVPVSQRSTLQKSHLRPRTCIMQAAPTWDEVAERIKDDFGGSKESVPKITAVCLSRGMGLPARNKPDLLKAARDFTKITGQKPRVTYYRKSEAKFGIREGQVAGVASELKDEKAFSMMDRLIHIVLPRVRDFQGLNPNSFDGKGNYTFGLDNCIVFPEIRYEDAFDRYTGMSITIKTTAATDEESHKFLSGWGLPFRASEGEEVDEQLLEDIDYVKRALRLGQYAKISDEELAEKEKGEDEDEDEGE